MLGLREVSSEVSTRKLLIRKMVIIFGGGCAQITKESLLLKEVAG